MRMDGVHGKFSVVYADPPWRYENQTGPQKNSAIELKYPTMTLPDICALPVPDICEDDAVLFLWATNPMLAKAVVVMAAWGFEYKTSAVWVKPSIGPGYWVRQQHEPLLIGRRGKMRHPEPAVRRSSVFEAARREHSRKPGCVAEYIEAAYPYERKIELFARERRKGWSSWGNQTDKF